MVCFLGVGADLGRFLAKEERVRRGGRPREGPASARSWAEGTKWGVCVGLGGEAVLELRGWKGPLLGGGWEEGLG